MYRKKVNKMTKLRILQLSDIHNVVCPRAMDDFKTMRSGLLKDIKNYCECYDCHFDAVLICGDIAFSGKNDEYEKSKIFIGEICKNVGCKQCQVFVVPGNHDKLRKEGKPSLRKILNWGFTHLDNREDMFRVLMKEEPDMLCNLYLPFKHYLDFCKSFDNIEPIMQKCINDSGDEFFHIDYDADEMFWKSDLAQDFHGYQVNLVGLNSALSCDENDWSPDWKPEGHKMYLSVFAHNNLDLPNNKSINILMMHHPMSFIVKGAELQNKFDELFAIQFYGHVHVADSSQAKTGGAVRVFSGAMQPPVGANEEEKKKYIPIYNIVELDMSDGDEKQLRVNLIVNKWNINNFVRDEEHCKEYFVDLPKEENRWKHENKTPVLPDGISIREIRCLYSDHMNHKKIINMMYDNLYDSSQNDYCNDRKFIAKVYADNKWVELWHLLNS